MTVTTQAIHLVCPHCAAVNRLPENRLQADPKCGKCRRALFTGHPIELTDANFAQHVQRSDLPVVVDFWAPWCGPCKMMAPAYQQAAELLESEVRLAKLNTEDHQRTAAQFGIRSIPTVIVFKQGKPIATQAGAMTTQQLVQWIRSNL